MALKKCMERERDLVAAACETLTRLFKGQHDSLIRQALDCELIQYLLGLLKSRAITSNNPATVSINLILII